MIAQGGAEFSGPSLGGEGGGGGGFVQVRGHFPIDSGTSQGGSWTYRVSVGGLPRSPMFRGACRWNPAQDLSALYQGA